MSRQSMPPINLKINKRAPRPAGKAGSVKLCEVAGGQSDRAAKLADRLVRACRENVRFLNFHLQRYEKYLEIPVLVDNALYLAYTIRVRDNASLDTLTLRKLLAEADIETSPAFSFTPAAEDYYTGSEINRVRQHAARSNLDSRAFCLGCHQYLTILDLEHIVETFDSIFRKYEAHSEKSSKDYHQRSRD